MHGCNTLFDIEIKKDGAISLWFIDWAGKKKTAWPGEKAQCNWYISIFFSEFWNKPAKTVSSYVYSISLVPEQSQCLLKEELPTQLRKLQIFTIIKQRQLKF